MLSSVLKIWQEVKRNMETNYTEFKPETCRKHRSPIGWGGHGETSLWLKEAIST